MITISNLSKRYKSAKSAEWVLKDINLQIPKNRNVGLIGPNGAGKSTLLKMIAGLEMPTKGEINRRCNVSWPIGLTGGFQISLSGRQNVKFVAKIFGADDISKIIDFVLDFSEIGKAFDKPVKTYSSGMKSRLAFGLSLAFDFDVYLSDEATSVGDASFRAKASRVFKERIDQASLIMVSHSESVLREFCESGILIKDKKAIWFEDLNDAISRYNLKK